MGFAGALALIGAPPPAEAPFSLKAADYAGFEVSLVLNSQFAAGRLQFKLAFF